MDEGINSGKCIQRKGGQLTKVSKGRIIIRTDVNKMQQKLKGRERLIGRRQNLS